MTHQSTTGGRASFYYGWIIIAVGFFTLTGAFGVWYSFSVFFLAIIRDFGWSRATGSSIFSIFIAFHAIVGILTGRLQDQFGPRVVIPVGSLLLALSLFATSQARELWHFYLAYGLGAAGGVSLIGFISHSAYLPNWFERKRGLAVGIAMAGIGFGMLTLVPLLEKLITIHGWRAAYQYAAFFVLFLIAPLNLILARKSPFELGLLPDGDSPETSSKSRNASRIIKIVDPIWADRNWTLKRAVVTKRFWYVAFGFFFVSFGYQNTLLHSVSAMVDGGLSQSTAAAFFGLLGIAGSGGKILFGYLSDILGRERVNLIGGGMAVAGIGCLMFIQGGGLLLPLLFALLFGIGYGSAAPLLPSVSADIFAGGSFGLIFAMIGLGGGLGGACGSFISGLLRDLTGRYTVSLLLGATSVGVSCFLISLASPGKIRKMVCSTDYSLN